VSRDSQRHYTIDDYFMVAWLHRNIGFTLVRISPTIGMIDAARLHSQRYSVACHEVGISPLGIPLLKLCYDMVVQ
jgi:hypothetical protein